MPPFFNHLKKMKRRGNEEKKKEKKVQASRVVEKSGKFSTLATDDWMICIGVRGKWQTGGYAVICLWHSRVSPANESNLLVTLRKSSVDTKGLGRTA